MSGSLYLKHDVKMKCYSRSWLRGHERYLRIVQNNAHGILVKVGGQVLHEMRKGSFMD